MQLKHLKNYQILLVFIALSMVMRFFSFFPSVINHDESTYILIAKAIRSGQLYFVDVFDTKPIGIFLLFGFFQELFGESIVVIRLFTSIWVALTAFFLYKVHLHFSTDKRAPITSGLIYIFITSIFTFYGVSPNTETFFNLFTILALWLILKNGHWLKFAAAGLLLGLAFIIKYVVLFDAFAFALFLAFLAYRKEMNFLQLIGKYFLLGLGFILPFSLALFFYHLKGALDQLFFYTFEVSGNYFIETELKDYLAYLGDFFLRFFPVSIWFFYCLFNRKFQAQKLRTLSFFWGASVLVVILLPGKLFGHYFIQFMLPFSLLAGSFFHPERKMGKVWKRIHSAPIGWGLLSLLVLVNLFFQFNDYYQKTDTPREIAAFLQPLLQEEDIIYTYDHKHILYHLLDKESPTPYVHPSLLLNPKNAKALEINKDEEMKKILDQKPRFIINQNKDISPGLLLEALNEDYLPLKSIGKKSLIFERK